MIVNKLMRNSKSLKIQGLALLFIGCDKTNIGELSSAVFFHHFVYPLGKPMIPHLLRCRVFAVVNYSFTLGRLGSGTSSTFDQLR
jgi:hypothetical protein